VVTDTGTETSTETSTETATAAAGATSTTTGTAESGSTAAAPAGATRTFAIDQAASEARFIINEMLLGAPTTVTGTTSLISGTLAIDPAAPANTSVGVITIDARDIKTDRNLRNRAIRRFILESDNDAYRYITFTPTQIDGLPATAAPGDQFSFTITGDLKIRDVTKPVTFQVDLTVDADNQVQGVAKAEVTRTDFNLQIPNVPGVADVTDAVQLELVFTANAE
jgi:polyisoprenoid-binding protein YceI